MNAPIIKADPQKQYLGKVLDILLSGGIVVSPTTTNYNLICDATNVAAIERVFKVKNRTKWGPLPVSLPYPMDVGRYTKVPNWFDLAILKRLLPGEISFIFHQKFDFPDKLTCGSGTVAVSCTSHPVFREIVKGVGRPIAATSANISGQKNIFVDLQKAIEDVGNFVDLILDAGPSTAELAGQGNRVNTIIDLTFEPPYLARLGWVSVQEVQRYFPNLITDIGAYKRVLLERLKESKQRHEF